MTASMSRGEVKRRDAYRGDIEGWTRYSEIARDDTVDPWRQMPQTGERVKEDAILDRRDLIAEVERLTTAVIDEPWLDRPEPGDWWVSIRPELRKGFPDVVPCIVFKWADKGGLFVRYSEGGDYLEFDQDWFAGAKWQRRATPADPFAKEQTK